MNCNKELKAIQTLFNAEGDKTLGYMLITWTERSEEFAEAEGENYPEFGFSLGGCWGKHEMKMFQKLIKEAGFFDALIKIPGKAQSK